MKNVIIDSERLLLRVLSISGDERGKWITETAHKLVQGQCEEDFVVGESATSTTYVPKNYTEDFLQFWDAYPQRSRSGKPGKKAAFKKWLILKKKYPNLLELCLDALKWQKEMDDWKKEGGKYIPMPTTYLNQQRWDDEKPVLSNETWTDMNGITHFS